MKLNPLVRHSIFTSFVTILWLIVIYIESARPPHKIIGLIPGLDKVAHFSVYGILGALFLTILTIFGFKKKLTLPISVLLVLLAGIFDEVHQSYVPLRNSDGWDLLADFCGGLFAITLLSRFIPIRKHEI